MDATATTEGLEGKETNDTEDKREPEPANQAEREDCLKSGAVRSTVGAATASLGREGSSAGEPEDPSDEENHSVAGNRRERTTDTSEEEHDLVSVGIHT